MWCSVATHFLLMVLVALMYWWFTRQTRTADRDRVPIQDDPDYRYTF